MEERYEFRASALRYGPCQGGPSDGKMLAHHADYYRIATYKQAEILRSMPGVVRSDDPTVKFGTYYWHGRVWIWEQKPEGQRMKLGGDGSIDVANRR